jgi:hypothetical protein
MVIDLAMLEKLVSSQFVWSILCLIVVIFSARALKVYISELKRDNSAREQKITDLYESHRKESASREKKLMDHLERTTVTLQNIEKSFGSLEHKMQEGFQEVWKHLDKGIDLVHDEERNIV